MVALLADRSAIVLVAHDTGVIAGSVAVRPDVTVPSGWLLSRLYVLPGCWGHGLGGRLHDAAVIAAGEAGAVGLHLWVLEANGRARGMYERRGWVLVPGRKLVNGNLDPPIEDVLYELDLATG